MVEFEWDPAKAGANERKHGVSFDEARLAFDDPHAVELLDDRFDYGEIRYVLIAMVGIRVLSIVYADRGYNRVRIISARPAGRSETDDYFEQGR
jgi:uncharacterized DUF497 family protein